MSIQGVVEVKEIEVAQVIQNLKQGVKLIASKPAVARVLLESYINRSIALKGTLLVTFTSPEGKDIFSKVQSDNYIRLSPGISDQKAEQQRKTIGGTLNFPLTADLLVHGNLQLRLLDLQTTNQDKVEFSGDIHEYTVHRGVSFPLRILGMRYSDKKGKLHSPRHEQFHESRSFLNRIFPISNADAYRPYPISSEDDSDLIIDAPDGFGLPLINTIPSSNSNSDDPVWERNINSLHAYAMALRGRDLDSNQNLRTRYYAMIDTARFRFNGAASDVPDYPSPSTVAAGGAQRIARNYDHYLLAHELGHTLGRLHPGACYGQIKEDKDYPYCSKNGTGNNRQAEAENEDTGCDGYISDKVKQHIGVDLTSEGTIKRLLNYDKWRDLMTYCDKKWISDYTYEGILDRIREEENLKIPPKGQYIKIIGIYDLRSKTGQILYAFPTIFDESISQDEVIDGKRVKLVLENQQEIEIESLRIGLKRREAKDLPDLTGVFQCTINRDQEVRYLRVDAGSKRNSEKYAIGWLTGSDVSEIEKISLNPFRTGAFANSMLNVDLSSDMPDLINPVYTVRVKENGKVEEIHERWHTIYLGTRFPTKVHLDPEVFPLDEAHSLKVTLSDGLDEIELFDGMISEKSPGADSAGDRP